MISTPAFTADLMEWYMTSRLICVNDIYSFDPTTKVSLDDFIDIIGRNFKQPKEGLGLDSSPSAHMWRTILWPTRFLWRHTKIAEDDPPVLMKTAGAFSGLRTPGSHIDTDK
jgi:hypothetical protein